MNPIHFDKRRTLIANDENRARPLTQRIRHAVVELFWLPTIASLLFVGACSSTSSTVRLTGQERNEIKKLFVVIREGGVQAITETLAVKQSTRGTEVSVVGGGGESMSRTTYDRRNRASVQAVKQCLSQSYPDKDYARIKFELMINEIENSPLRSFDIEIATSEQRRRFEIRSDEERIGLMKEVGADASLVLVAGHNTGLHSHTFGFKTYDGAYSRLGILMYDWEDRKAIYSPGSDYTDDVDFPNDTFCADFIRNYEATVDTSVRKWTDQILDPNL